MICELCGSEAPRLIPTRIEESVLQVCSRCQRYGEVQVSSEPKKKESDQDVVKERLEKRERRQKGRDIYTQISKELAADYDVRIRKARQRMGMDQKKLAAKIQEKKSIIAKLETRSMRPDDRLMKKLEGTLGIKLTEEIEVENIQRRSSSGSFTIGDIIMMKMKEKKK